MQSFRNNNAGAAEEILVVAEGEMLNLEELFYKLEEKFFHDYGTVLETLNEGIPGVLATRSEDEMSEKMRDTMLRLVEKTDGGDMEVALCHYTKDRVCVDRLPVQIAEGRKTKRVTRSIVDQVSSLDFYDLVQLYVMLLCRPHHETAARLRADGVDFIDRVLAGVGSTISPARSVDDVQPHMMKFYLFTNRLAYYTCLVRRASEGSAAARAYDTLVSLVRKMATLLPAKHQLVSVAKCLTCDASSFIPLRLPIAQSDEGDIAIDIPHGMFSEDEEGWADWIKQKVTALFHKMFGGWVPGLVAKLGLDKLLEWLKTKICDVLDPGHLISGIIAKYVNWKTAAIFGGIVAMCFVILIAGILNFLPQRGINNVISICTHTPLPEAQGGDKIDATVQTGSFVLTVITVALTAYAGIDLSTIRWGATLLGSVVSTSNNLAKLFVNLLHVLPSSLLRGIRKVLGEPDADLVTDSCIEAIAEWHALESLSWVIGVNTSNEYLEALDKCEVGLMKAFAQATKSKSVNSLAANVSRCISDCGKLRGKLGLAKDYHPKRPYPFWAHFWADPGVGKSQCVEKLVRRLGAHGWFNPMKGEMEHRDPGVYARTATDKWWSRYDPSTHDLVIWDEFVNQTSSTDVEKQVLAMVNLCSCTPYSLPMPSNEVNPTGMIGTNFESSMIVTMSNTPSVPLGPGDLTNGLYRRQNFLVKVIPNPDYMGYRKGTDWQWGSMSDEVRVRLINTGCHLCFEVYRWKWDYRDDSLHIAGKELVKTLTGYDELASEFSKQQIQHAKLSFIQNDQRKLENHDPKTMIAEARKQMRSLGMGVLDKPIAQGGNDSISFYEVGENPRGLKDPFRASVSFLSAKEAGKSRIPTYLRAIGGLTGKEETQVLVYLPLCVHIAVYAQTRPVNALIDEMIKKGQVPPYKQVCLDHGSGSRGDDHNTDCDMVYISMDLWRLHTMVRNAFMVDILPNYVTLTGHELTDHVKHVYGALFRALISAYLGIEFVGKRTLADFGLNIKFVFGTSNHRIGCIGYQNKPAWFKMMPKNPTPIVYREHCLVYAVGDYWHATDMVWCQYCDDDATFKEYPKTPQKEVGQVSDSEHDEAEAPEAKPAVNYFTMLANAPALPSVPVEPPKLDTQKPEYEAVLVDKGAETVADALERKKADSPKESSTSENPISPILSISSTDTGEAKATGAVNSVPNKSDSEYHSADEGDVLDDVFVSDPSDPSQAPLFWKQEELKEWYEANGCLSVGEFVVYYGRVAGKWDILIRKHTGEDGSISYKAYYMRSNDDFINLLTDSARFAKNFEHPDTQNPDTLTACARNAQALDILKRTAELPIDAPEMDVKDSLTWRRLFAQWKIKIAATVAGVSAVGLLIYMAYKRLTRGDEYVEEDFVPDSQGSALDSEPFNDSQSASRGVELRKHRVIRRKPVVIPQPESQGIKVRMPVLKFGDHPDVRGLGVKGNYLLTYKHGVDWIAADDHVTATLVLPDKEFEVTIDGSEIVEIENKDVAMIVLHGKTLERFADATNLFIDDETLKRFINARLGWFSRTHVPSRQIQWEGVSTYRARLRYAGSQQYYAEDIAQYTANTFAGDCGNPLWYAHHDGTWRIMGIHIAGSTDGRSGYANPRAYAQIVTQKDILMMLGVEEEEPLPSAQGNPLPMEVSGPNLDGVDDVPEPLQVYVPNTNNFMRSPAGELNLWPTEKAPSRVAKTPEGHDVLEKAFNDLASFEQPAIDMVILNAVKEDLTALYKNHVDFRGVDRCLTLEEAVRGIEGTLASIRLETSAGWPLCLTPGANGKRKWIHLPADASDVLYIDPALKTYVQEFIESMRRGERQPFFWLAYPKSEIVKLAKIEEGRTRAIYCGSLVHNIAFRMLFGSVLIGFNHMGHESAIGTNPQSTDFGIYEQYLSEVANCSHGVCYIAGDYKSFDQHYIRVFQLAAYDIMWELLPPLVKQEVGRDVWDLFVDYQTQSWVQYKDKRYHFGCAHYSGCLLTTPINITVNSLMMRYMFKLLYPALRYDDCVRGVFLGDDHILCVDTRKCTEFNQQYLIDEFPKRLNQVYTDDNKKTVDVEKFRPFDKISFLGCTPIFMENVGYVGALRKSTLEQNVQWMHDSTKSDWGTTVQGYLRMAANWDREYFDEYCRKLKIAFQAVAMPWTEVSYGERYTNAMRSSASGETYPMCQSGVITEFSNTAEEADSYIALPSGRAGGGIGGGDIPIELGMDSYLYKKSVLWTKSMIAGHVVASYSLPQDLLSDEFGDLQTTKFKSFGLYRSNLKVRVRINGNGFQAGALLIYWLPLVKKSYTIGYNDILATQHIMLTPKDTREAVMEIPYVHPYQYIPTDRSFGTLVVRVFSQLNYVNGSDVDVMISLAFDNYEFAIPQPISQGLDFDKPLKPVEDVTVDPKPRIPNADTVNPAPVPSDPKQVAYKLERRQDGQSGKAQWVRHENFPQQTNQSSQGKRFSKGKKAQRRKKVAKQSKAPNVANAQNWYNMLTKKYGGIPPVKEGESAMLTRKGYVVVDTKSGQIVSAPPNFNKTLISDLIADLENIAPNTVKALRTKFPTASEILEWLDFLDNPPKVSTGTPVHQSYPPMANVVGERETKVLDLHPAALYRPGRFYMDPTQMDLNFLLGREFVVGTFNWSTTQVANQNVFSLTLNSLMVSPGEKGGAWNGNVALATLNQFQFWHARFHLHFRVFKTRFHTGSLRVILSYGQETPIEKNRYTGYNKVLTFGVEEEEQEFVVEWVAPTDYLRTWDGPRAHASTYMGSRDFSLGCCAIEVANQLNVANPQVPNSVSVVITCTLDDVRVAVPKVVPTVIPLLTGVKTGSITFAQSATAEDVLVPEPDITTEESFADADYVGEVEPPVGKGHSGLDVGAQFEFLAGNVLDLGRRYVEITPNLTSVAKTWPVPIGETSGLTSYWTLESDVEGAYLYDIPVTPSNNPFMNFYRGFSGGMSFRLYIPNGGQITKVIYCPSYGGQMSLGPLLLAGGGNAKYWNANTSTTITANVSLTYNELGSTTLPCMVATEMATPVGQGSWIDVTVPYQQHVGFMTAETSGVTGVDGICMGTLSFIGPEGVKVYAKFSDDASVGVFVPPNEYKYVFASLISNGVDATGILGYFN